MALESYFFNILIFVGIYIILAISLQLVVGFTGLLNLGHVAFYGIGAYTSALLSLQLGFPFWLALIFAAGVAALFGFLLAIPTLKLRGDYFALATLGFAIIIENIMRNWQSVTRGPLGLPGIPKPEFFGYTFSSLFSYLLLVAFFALLTYFVISRITASPFGRTLKSIREDELVAKTLGKNTFKFKTLALVISAAFAGIAGSLYAHYITFIDPTSFTILESVLILAMIIIGGLATINGAVIGAFLLVILPEPLRFLPIPSYAIGALRQLIYSALLILIILRKPGGILGKPEA